MSEQTVKPSVIVVGSVHEDRVSRVVRFPEPGETVRALKYQRHLGGKGANQAVAARLFNDHVVLISSIGEDPAGSFARTSLESHGIDTSHLSTVDSSETGIATICVDENGENTVVAWSGANRFLPTEAIHQCIDKAVTPFSKPVVLSQGETPVDAINETGRAASRVEARFILNLAPVVDVEPAVIALADPLIVNYVEARTLVGPDVLEAEIITSLGKLAKSVVLTLGAAGATILEDGVETQIPAFRVDEVVDTTGAGDAFCGALAARLAAGDSLGSAATTASAIAAVVVQSEGAQATHGMKKIAEEFIDELSRS